MNYWAVPIAEACVPTKLTVRKLEGLTVNIAFRAACNHDVAFARSLYFDTMREIITRLFGWDQRREEENFARFFKLEEVRIITADGRDVGWIQEQVSEKNINLGSFYVLPAMQGRGTAHRFCECFWKGLLPIQKL